MNSTASPDNLNPPPSMVSPSRQTSQQRIIQALLNLVAQNHPNNRFATYQFEPEAYIQRELGWSPWAKQAEVIAAYRLALLQLHEKADYEAGTISREGLTVWQPGQEIKNWLAIDAGHNVGKTKLLAGLVSHFFDCFAPSITYAFAPTGEQINDLLFKEIRVDRRGKALPGEVMEEPRIKYAANHFVKGKATNNAKGAGTERAQGQHGKYLLFVLDEAEGIPKFIWDAVRSMASGGMVIVLVARNPRTTTCMAHKIRRWPTVAEFRISCLDHPNVLEDREIIPGSIRRPYIESMLEECQTVDTHNPDQYTLEVPWQPGVIYRPTLETLWRVLGIASAQGVDDTFCPSGRYEAATQRAAPQEDATIARIGVDVARYGNDRGRIYVRHEGRIFKAAEIERQDGFAYYLAVKEAALALSKRGVTNLHVRVDGGGGYGSTCIDNLRRDEQLRRRFEEFKVVEVYFNGVPYDTDKFADTITELYYHAGQALAVWRLDSPSPDLEVDLCERTYRHVIVNREGKTKLDAKQLVTKEQFKKLHHHSPDDGDGLALAAAPDHVLRSHRDEIASSSRSVSLRGKFS